MLKFTNEDVKQALEGKYTHNMERKIKTLQSKIDEIHGLKTIMQETRIERGDDMEYGKYSRIDNQDRRLCQGVWRNCIGIE